MLYFRILSQDMNCVAAIGVVHFSVRGFGCALFYFRKEYEKMRAKKFSAVVTAATAVVVMLTGCGEGEQSSNAVNSESSAMSGEISIVSTASSADSSTGSENVIDSNVGDFSYDIGEFDDRSTYAKITGYHGTATDVTLPVTEYQGYNVTVIGTEAFKDSNIKRMVIPEGYIAFESGAFNDCTELEELYLPDSMEDFMENSYVINASQDFCNCYKLTQLHFMGYTSDIQNKLLGEDYKIYRNISNGIYRIVRDKIDVVKRSKSGMFEGTATIPVYYDYSISGSPDAVKFDLSNVNLDISGVDKDGNEWTIKTFFDSINNNIAHEIYSYSHIFSKNDIIFLIIVIKDGECTQVAASAELDITKYKEITDEDYTDEYFIDGAVVGRWDAVNI